MKELTKEERVEICNKAYKYASQISLTEYQQMIGESCYEKGYMDAREDVLSHIGFRASGVGQSPDYTHITFYKEIINLTF